MRVRVRVRVWLSLLVGLSCLGVADGTGASALPDAAALEAKVDALAQIAPPNYRETVVSHGADGDGGYVTYHRFDDLRSVRGTGALQEQSGIFQHETWRHDANGVTVVADDPPDDPTVLTVARADGSPATLVLSRLTSRGFGTRTYVDAATLRPLKIEQTDPNVSTTTTYTSYGTFGGYTMPATWTVTSNAAGPMTTTQYTRTDVVLGGVTADDVAEPPTRDIVSFPAGVTRADLPATFTNGRTILHAKAGGHDALFLLDSGSSIMTITPALAKRLGVVPVQTIEVHGAGTIHVNEGVIPILQIGPLTMHDVVVSIVDSIGSYGFDQSEYGTIGFDFLATLAVTIDYLHQHVTAESGWDYRAPADRSTFAVPVRLGDMVPTAEAVINGARSNRLIFDTGYNATLFLFRYFSGAHPEIFDQPQFADVAFQGVGATVVPQKFSFRTIKLGRLTLEHFDGYRVGLDSRAFNLEADGLFGTGFLSHFTVIFDFVHGQILLQENHDGGLLPAGR